jgi:predicted permease
MLTTSLIILPIFALILAGFIAGKAAVLGADATAVLNRFVVYLALPALLFNVVAHAKWQDLDQPGFLAVFGLSCLVVFAVTIALRWRRPRHLADASLDGLNAGYANVGFIGFPLCLTVFGKASLPLTTIAAVVTVCIVFAIGIVLIEVSLQEEANIWRLLTKVGLALAKNPLLIAPAAGAVMMASGVSLPGSVNVFFTLLGNAASPCALVVLGLFFAERKPKAGGIFWASLPLVMLKLLAQPGLAWVFATVWLRLPPEPTHVAVVLAALPTGTGPFMLAEFYGREAAVTSSTILLSTIFSLVTVSAYLACIS